MKPELRRGLEFERLYEAFGGKIAHWQDYVSDYGECEVDRFNTQLLIR